LLGSGLHGEKTLYKLPAIKILEAILVAWEQKFAGGDWGRRNGGRFLRPMRSVGRKNSRRDIVSVVVVVVVVGVVLDDSGT
jgi:hypothetical protein